METDATVFVVDDDQAVRESLSRLMESVGRKVATYASAQKFLDSYDPSRRGCLVLDIRMPGMSGLDLQDKLAQDGVRIPVIIISGHGDVEKAVRAMKAGAVDFLRKPYKAKVLHGAAGYRRPQQADCLPLGSEPQDGRRPSGSHHDEAANRLSGGYCSAGGAL